MRYTELQISSALLDQPAFVGAPKKLFICSTPRSGSYLLCRHMINAGLGVPHEYFNPYVIHQIAPRLGLGESASKLNWRPRGWRDKLMLSTKERAAEADFLRTYLKILIPRRCQSGVFAAKIHFRDFRRVLDNALGHELLDGALFIHLYREDLLKQAISEHTCQLTGRWGIDDTITTPPAASPNFFDLNAIDRALDNVAEQDRGWRMFLAQRGVAPMSISCERLSEDPFSFVVAVARRLGMDPAMLRRGYSEAPPPAETAGLPSKAEMARRYLAARCHERAEPGRQPGAASLIEQERQAHVADRLSWSRRGRPFARRNLLKLAHRLTHASALVRLSVLRTARRQGFQRMADSRPTLQTYDGPRHVPHPSTAAWVGAAAAIAMALAAAPIAGVGLNRAGIELGLRLTARFGFLLFWPCYAAGALVVLFGARFMPLKRRARDLGLAFAAVLAVHLGLVGALCAIGAPPALRVFMIFGPGAACALLLALASIDSIGLEIGAAGWWILRNVGMNYLAFDFAIDFVRLQPLNSIPGLLAYLPFAAFAVLGPALRGLAWLKGRMARPEPC